VQGAPVPGYLWPTDLPRAKIQMVITNLLATHFPHISLLLCDLPSLLLNFTGRPDTMTTASLAQTTPQ